jgi:flagellin-specific chaperone FliS
MKKPNKVPTYMEAPEYSRFDFEQEFMNCWNIIDDLKSTLNRSNQNQLVEAIVVLYSHKFENCFDRFEEMVANKQL